MKSAFLFTSGDGRSTANAFWINIHLAIIPMIEKVLCALGYEIVWLHPTDETVDSVFRARNVGQKILEQHSHGDLVIDLTTGWNWPAHFGIIPTMIQEEVRQEALKLILICNMAPKAPGYVANRANALCLEIMELAYASLTVLKPTEANWAKLKAELEAVIAGTYVQEVPSDEVEVTEEHRAIAQEALKQIRYSGGISPIIGHCASMTMDQGWPHLYLAKKLGLNPIPIGSNQFRADVDAVPLNKVLGWYDELKQRGLNFAYTAGGLCEEEIFRGLQMYGAMDEYRRQGAIGVLSQGQMDWTAFDVADDLPLSLLMTSNCLGRLDPFLAITEADWEAHFTSVMMKYIIWVKYGRWAEIGFHDIRHYEEQEDTLVLLNSGALSLGFMTDAPGDWSDIWAVSQNRDVYFLKGGACIKGNMRPREDANLFRVHGKGNSYRLQAARIDLLPLSWELRQQAYGELDDWPMGIAKMKQGRTRAITLGWLPNHGQHCEEDIQPEMRALAEELGIGFTSYAA